MASEQFDIEGEEWEELIAGVREGNNAACTRFWNLFGPLIQRVAARHISPSMKRRIGQESILLSACRTFFHHAQQGEYDIPDSDSVWRLLCAITVNKVRMKVRYHSSQRRDLRAEVHGDSVPDIPAENPSTVEELEFAEHLDHLLSQFDDEEKRVVEGKLQGMSNAEIAESMGCSERTIRRLLNRLQLSLQSMLAPE
ncbi:MAG: sigma-70 family RNA polymerase sigma factor [Planctomycetaceae bacterium]